MRVAMGGRESRRGIKGGRSAACAAHVDVAAGEGRPGAGGSRRLDLDAALPVY